MLKKIERIDRWCQDHDEIVGIIGCTISIIVLGMLGGF